MSLILFAPFTNQPLPKATASREAAAAIKRISGVQFDSRSPVSLDPGYSHAAFAKRRWKTLVVNEPAVVVSSYFSREKVITQFFSQVFPPSPENACSKTAPSFVIFE